MKLTERQKKFAEYYVQCGNRTQAAKMAGYSDSYAEHRADELWRNVEIQAYIRQLSEQTKQERILTAQKRQEILSDIARDRTATSSDRIRAIDTLNKMTGEYTVRVNMTERVMVVDDLNG